MTGSLTRRSFIEAATVAAAGLIVLKWDSLGRPIKPHPRPKPTPTPTPGPNVVVESGAATI